MAAKKSVRLKSGKRNAPRKLKVKVGVFGARRGLTMINVMAQHPDAKIVAICDRHEPTLEACKRMSVTAGSKITYYSSVDKFFEHDFDAVVLANYANEHAPYAVRALDSGRHVVSEVLAVQTLNEAVELVEAVERSGKVYAYAENYCYMRATQEMRRLYRKGDLGEFMHGEGEYVHNCEPIWPFITYGEPEHWRNIMYSTFYCTHSLGPLLTITGTRPARVVGLETPNTGWHYGMRGGSSAMILAQMSNGATVKSLHAISLHREPSSIWYCVYGTKGMVESDRWGDLTDAVNLYIEQSPGVPHGPTRYKPTLAIETELSRKIGGHGGSDFYTMHFFLEKILGRSGGEEIIDVYTALDMTVPGILAYKSILSGNTPFDVPDFRDKTVRGQFRGDKFCTDPKVAGDQLAPPCSFPVPETPEAVYKKQRDMQRGKSN